jgi:hypothetical protein
LVKTYRSELTGAIRGNARLRRLIRKHEARIAMLSKHIAKLITVLDMAGCGDEPEVVRSAAAIGWTRMTPGQRADVARRAKEMQP